MPFPPLWLVGAKVKTSSAAQNMPKCLNRTINAERWIQRGFVGMKRWWIWSQNGHSSYRVAACICHFLGNPTNPPPITECHAHSYVNGACISSEVFFLVFFFLFLCLTKPDSTDIVRIFDPRVQLCGRWLACWWGRWLVLGWIVANIPLLWPPGQWALGPDHYNFKCKLWHLNCGPQCSK